MGPEVKVSAEAAESNSCAMGADESRMELGSLVNRRRSERISRGGRREPCRGQVGRDQAKKERCWGIKNSTTTIKATLPREETALS